MNQKVITSDIYEAAYYLTLGAAIIEAELIEENKRKICIFTLTGESLTTKAQGEYFNCTAIVNLWDFRRCFTRVSSVVGSVKANDKKKSSLNKGGDK